MTHHLISEIAGPDVGRISTGLNEALSPREFAAACQKIVERHSGDEAHRELDRLVTTLLNSLGYSEGMAIFLAAAAPAHIEGSAA
jgi:hypothetical protein